MILAYHGVASLFVAAPVFFADVLTHVEEDFVVVCCCGVVFLRRVLEDLVGVGLALFGWRMIRGALVGEAVEGL